MSSDILFALEKQLENLEAALSKLVEEQTELLVKEAEVSSKIQSNNAETARIRGAIAALNGETPVAPTPPIEPEAPEQGEPQPKRNKRQRDPNDPLANMSCKGCGEKGTLRESLTDFGGKLVRMMVCRECGSQSVF